MSKAENKSKWQRIAPPAWMVGWSLLSDTPREAVAYGLIVWAIAVVGAFQIRQMAESEWSPDGRGLLALVWVLLWRLVMIVVAFGALLAVWAFPLWAPGL